MEGEINNFIMVWIIAAATMCYCHTIGKFIPQAKPPIIYDPLVSSSALVIGRRWAPLPAILATYVVSGLMHELVFYYIKREKRMWEAWEPSWDAMCFFLLHGVCLTIEVALKKALGGEVAAAEVVVVAAHGGVHIFYTTLWQFVPALVRCRVYDKGAKELNALTEFGKVFYDVLR